MGAKVAATCIHWSQPVVSHSPSLSQPTCAFSCWSPRRTLVRFVRPSIRSPLLGFGFGVKLPRSRSCEVTESRGRQLLRRSCSASSDNFSDEEFAKILEDLALRFHHGDGDGDVFSDFRDKENQDSAKKKKTEESSRLDFLNLYSSRTFPPAEPPWAAIRPEWPHSDEIISGSVERKANSVDLPLSLRMLKRRKKQWEGEVREAGESAYCSVKKAFSSMVFIIQELQAYTLHMRELLFYQDLQGILVRVQKEMNASFVWLFQHIFSCTPTLMLYVMILLANFTVYSMTNTTAFAATLPPSYTTATATATDHKQSKFDPLSIKSFSVVSSGRTASVGGNGGGGGKVKPVAGAMDGGDGRFDEMLRVSSDGNSAATTEEERVSSVPEGEAKLWNSVVEEASGMQERLRQVSLDHETMQRFVSPVSVEMVAEDYAEYFRTELVYQHAVLEEPNNPLILCNYAQFLYLVLHDHDRAEEYFKRAVRCVEPPEADSLSRYASFLWLARNELEAAEETFLEAIAADPSNTFHAANYAHFLWNTGGEDTCFPLSADDA